MANLVRLPKVPCCLFCLRRIANCDISDLVVPFRRQLRGAKKSRAPTVLNVRLLEDIQGYGPKDAVIPVAPGRMRNILYPRRVAAYVSEEELRDLREREIPIERDFAFGIVKPKPTFATSFDDDKPSPEPSEEAVVIDVPMPLVSPQDSSDILSSSLPQFIQFNRIPIPNPRLEMSAHKSRPPEISDDSSNTASNTDSGARQASPVSIYGSVSTADIAEQVKAVLSETMGEERVVLGAEDITILNNGDEEVKEGVDRLKMLGDFPVVIRVRNADAVRRTVRITARESS